MKKIYKIIPLILLPFITSCNVPYLETQPKTIIANVKKHETNGKSIVNLITPEMIISFANVEPYKSWKKELILEDFFISYKDKNRNGKFDECDELDGTHFKVKGKSYHQYWKCE